MKLIFFILVFILTAKSLSAQGTLLDEQEVNLSESEKDIELFDKPVYGILMGKPFLYRSMTSRDVASCKLRGKDTVLISGYFKFERQFRYLIESEDCRGYLWDLFVKDNVELENQLKIAKQRKGEKIVLELQEGRRKSDAQALQNKLEYESKCQYKTNEVDSFNGKIRKYTEIYRVGNGDLVIQLSNYGGLRYVSFSTTRDLGCASPYSTSKSFAKVKLENGDIITFNHFGDINCHGFDLDGKLTSGEKERLKKSPVDQIRLQGTEYYHDFDEIYYKTIFIDKLKCIE